MMSCVKAFRSGSNMSTDGAVYRSSRKAGCGGLIRDQDGCWVRGFKKRIGITSPLTVELWGIFYGLSLAWNIQASRVEIESDSINIIKYLNKEASNELEDNHVMKKIKELISRDWEISFSFIPSKLNRCVDYLAKESLSASWNLDILDSPPCCIRKDQEETSERAKETTGSGKLDNQTAGQRA
ncbi:ribonuclease H [Senna tora]|uniref:Ribonuclease H n=1 Tax=Senna tora TaxID=362788 RepID=A0A834T0L3_9FABA|nr:ribonuclease H [Senna tora]